VWSDGVRGRARTSEEARGVNEKGEPMTGSRLIGIAVALIVIGGVAYFAFPGIRAKIDDAYDKHAGWTPEARRKNPVGFIEHSIKQLEDNVAKFTDIRAELRSGIQEMKGIRDKNAANVAFADKELGLFKAAFKEANAGKGWPVMMAGKNYTEAELKNQVEVFLRQKASYEGAVAQVDNTLKTLETKQSDLDHRIVESRTNLDLLKNQKALVKADQLTADTEKMMAEVNEVLIRNDAMASDISVRTIEEYKKDAMREPAAAKATPKADEFLKS
jgi:hypothetical protein